MGIFEVQRIRDIFSCRIGKKIIYLHKSNTYSIMKKIAILVWCVALGFVAQAQVLEGSIAPLLNESRVNFKLTFEKANIHGMTEAEFSATFDKKGKIATIVNNASSRTIIEHTNGWKKDQPIISGGFVNCLNEAIKETIRFGSYSNAKYTLKVEVLDVSTSGDFDSDVYLLDNTGKELAKITRLVASGGTFGTKIALIKDGAKHSGIVLGKFLLKELKKAKKNKKKEGR